MATLEPVVAAALGYVLLAERLDLSQVLGGILVVSAVVMAGLVPAKAPGIGAG